MPIRRSESGVSPTKSKLILMGEGFNESVNSYQHLIRTFTPRLGKIWTVINMRLSKSAPVGGSSGTHSFLLRVAGNAHLSGESNFGSAIEWNMNTWKTADSMRLPSSEDAVLLALHNIVCDHDNPLEIDYFNGIDVASGGFGDIYVSVLETSII